MKVENIISQIRKKQDELIVMINSTFDEIVNDISRMNISNVKEDNEFEVTYPLTNKAGFKGEKVVAVILNGKRVISPTWKNVVKIILEDALNDEERLDKMHKLSNVLLGRKRNRVSSNPDDMRSPLKICKDLYVETHYDTETLINLLLEILNNISYDYSKIMISIKK